MMSPGPCVTAGCLSLELFPLNNFQCYNMTNNNHTHRFVFVLLFGDDTTYRDHEPHYRTSLQLWQCTLQKCSVSQGPIIDLQETPVVSETLKENGCMTFSL